MSPSLIGLLVKIAVKVMCCLRERVTQKNVRPQSGSITHERITKVETIASKPMVCRPPLIDLIALWPRSFRIHPGHQSPSRCGNPG